MDLKSVNGRKKVVEYIESNANRGRKATSYKASEIFNDRLKPYVIEDLRKQYNEETVQELPVVSSVNIAKRVINSLACIYRSEPHREFTEVSDDQAAIINLVYKDMMANKKLNHANKIYKNHDQGFIQIIPKNGRLVVRTLKPHQVDVIPSMYDPEEAAAYIISTYNNSDELNEDSKELSSATGYQTVYESNTENYKNKKAINAQKDDNKRYLVWTMEESFFMDAKGNILGEVTPNPLRQYGLMPFVEFSTEKEFEFWVRAQNAFSNFTIEFNTAVTSVFQIVKLQGFAQAYLKCNPDAMPQSIQIGPNYILRLPVDTNAGIDTEFGFASPGSDIAGSLSFLETLLATFLSSNGIDPKTVSMKGEGQTYTSGIERLLATIEKVSAAREDFDTFARVEDKVWRLVKAWLNILTSTETLDRKYWTGSISEDSSVNVEFSKPELIKSDMEELDVIQREIELGISSPIDAIMRREGLDREQAEQRYLDYQNDNFMGLGNGPQNREIGSQSDNQP